MLVTVGQSKAQPSSPKVLSLHKMGWAALSERAAAAATDPAALDASVHTTHPQHHISPRLSTPQLCLPPTLTWVYCLLWGTMDGLATIMLLFEGLPHCALKFSLHATTRHSQKERCAL